jgi:hypothetical protein
VIPKSMLIPDCSEGAVEREQGGFTDVLQGTYRGRRVAIKVVHVYLTSDLDIILSVSPRPASSHLMNERIAELLPGGSRLEAPPASKHLATAWGDSR